ncbi:MAG TPA: ABC transporter permease [Sumerlaeia bacterium]|nr:ABC transporter permease [Sumerlaeia bacterium]
MKIVRIERVVRMAVKNLAQYKMRAGLTVLGIIFGVCSVVAMLSVGEGASREIQEQLQQQGSRNIWLASEKLPEEQLSGGQTNSSRIAIYGLTYDDANRFSRIVPNLESLTPSKKVRFDVRFQDRSKETEIVATTPWCAEIKNLRVLAGRFISPRDMEEGAPVCAIGARLARTLFAAYDPIGKNMKVGNDVYRVVGVVADKFSTPEFENKPPWFVGDEEQVYIPLKTYVQRNGDMFVRFGGGASTMEKVELHEVILTLREQDHVMQAAEVVRNVLRGNHSREDYQIKVPLQLIRQMQATRRLFNIVLGSIAAISLIVGGIGIMNIMLATVSERTREIGIRRALGARRRDIVAQFLVETLVLSISGGLIGLLGGVIIPKTITFLTDVRTVLTPLSFIIAFGVSVAVGIVFGLYPARRAALMDPIEALRHE